MWLVDTLTCLFMSCAPAHIERSPVTTSMGEDVTSDALPVVCWHGINDDARSCDMIFASLNSSTETLSIQVRHNHHNNNRGSDPQVGDTLEADKYNSIFMGMMDQVTPYYTSS